MKLRKKKFTPIEYLEQIFELDAFEVYCLEQVFSADQEGQKDPLTPQILARGFGVEQYYPYFWPDGRLMRYFFIRAKGHKGDGLALDERIRLFLEGDIQGYGSCDFLWERIDPAKEGKELTGNGPVPVMERFLEKYGSAGPVYYHIFGRQGSGRKSWILEFCRRQNRSLLILDGRILKEENQELLGDALRECRIYGAYLMIQDLPEGWFAEGAYQEKLFYWMGQEAEVLFTVGEGVLTPGRYLEKMAYLELELSIPGFEESCVLWEKNLKRAGAGKLPAKEWANKFVFSPGQIEKAVDSAVRYAFIQNRSVLCREDIQRGCYHLLREGMGKKAVRIRCGYTWEDLILPSVQKEKLREACSQVLCRKQVYEAWGFEKTVPYGRGTSVIFAGPPGTGKTMAAQVIASELCLDLYRIELSAVVSKYIGETEKNLEEIFEQAKKSQVILFFDEADVLFSKRTEVRDSNDKYSNMEAAFLLQKMEEYEGITVLATNFLQNFDEAFKRRMKFIIDFPFPDAMQRLEIWKKIFPRETPVKEEMDYEFLASSFELSGSNIRNAALHGAFLAAAQGEGVSMEHVLRGVQNEYAKSGKILGRKQLGQYYMLLEGSGNFDGGE